MPEKTDELTLSAWSAWFTSTVTEGQSLAATASALAVLPDVLDREITTRVKEEINRMLLGGGR
jgi:hypothetical protein